MLVFKQSRDCYPVLTLNLISVLNLALSQQNAKIHLLASPYTVVPLNGNHASVKMLLREFWSQCSLKDRLSGLVVRVSGYRSRGPGSISCATRFSKK
jgi:hypothetical protein